MNQEELKLNLEDIKLRLLEIRKSTLNDKTFNEQAELTQLKWLIIRKLIDFEKLKN